MSNPRSTRPKIQQSKFGCYTCKARRVKCDETKPTCLRCTKANRRCEGFPTGSLVSAGDLRPTSLPLRSVGADCLAVGDTLKVRSLYGFGGSEQANVETLRFSWLGCEAFARNHYTTASGISQSIWQRLLPQLKCSNASVYAATAAFGAAYEWHYLAGERSSQAQIAISLYTSAIQVIQHEISTLPNGPIPPLLACVLLASSDLLHRRQGSALTHLTGAFRILSLHERDFPSCSSKKATSTVGLATRKIANPFSTHEEVLFLFQSLDLQLASYSFSCPPHLTYAREVHLSLQSFTFTTVQEAHLRLLPVLNYCYRYIAQSRRCKYRPKPDRKQDFAAEECRRVALLDQWLLNLKDQVIYARNGTDESKMLEGKRLTSILSAHVMSTAINVSVAAHPLEKAYDAHAPRFDHIIADAAVVLSQLNTTGQDLGQFSLGIGLAEPLFFTACKYRHPAHRRHAISMLEKLGREGPWDAKLLAAVATRIVEIEEDSLVHGQSATPRNIEECVRVHSCTMTEHKLANLVDVGFSRCRSFRSTSDGFVREQLGDHSWERWSETLEVDRSWRLS